MIDHNNRDAYGNIAPESYSVKDLDLDQGIPVSPVVFFILAILILGSMLL